jgi:hypothetical protein
MERRLFWNFLLSGCYIAYAWRRCAINCSNDIDGPFVRHDLDAADILNPHANWLTDRNPNHKFPTVAEKPTALNQIPLGRTSDVNAPQHTLVHRRQ